MKVITPLLDCHLVSELLKIKFPLKSFFEGFRKNQIPDWALKFQCRHDVLRLLLNHNKSNISGCHLLVNICYFLYPKQLSTSTINERFALRKSTFTVGHLKIFHLLFLSNGYFDFHKNNKSTNTNLIILKIIVPMYNQFYAMCACCSSQVHISVQKIETSLYSSIFYKLSGLLILIYLIAKIVEFI